MSMIRWSEEKIRKMTFWDMGIVKTSCILFGLIIGAFISAFVKEYLWIFVLLFFSGYITAIYKFFVKK